MKTSKEAYQYENSISSWENDTNPLDHTYFPKNLLFESNCFCKTHPLLAVHFLDTTNIERRIWSLCHVCFNHHHSISTLIYTSQLDICNTGHGRDVCLGGMMQIWIWLLQLFWETLYSPVRGQLHLLNEVLHPTFHALMLFHQTACHMTASTFSATMLISWTIGARQII